MPILTPHYKLTAFERGDPYLSSSDLSRFYIIDNQIKWLSDLTGNGVVFGLNVSTSGSSASETIEVSSGMANVNGFIMSSFGPMQIEVDNNGVYYLYLQLKRDIVSNFGPPSNIANIVYNDSVAPSKPTALTVIDKSYDYINISWDKNTDIDLYGYSIYRNSTYLDFTTDNNYIDYDVNDDTVYSYHVIAVDLSGNNSASSDILSVSTTIDLTPPLNPSYPFSLELDEAVQLSWQEPEVGDIAYYTVLVFGAVDSAVSTSYPQLNTWATLTVDEWAGLFVDATFSGSLIGSYTTSETNIVISNLSNFKLYKIVLFAVSVNGVQSSGIYSYMSPLQNPGPSEVTNINLSQSVVDNTDNINIRASWDTVVDPYKTTASYFILTIIENGSVVSDPICVYSKNSYTFNNFSSAGQIISVKPLTYYIVKIQAVDTNGNVSNGIVRSISTSKFSSPLAPRNLTTKLLNNKSLLIAWDNANSVFDKNIISINITDLSDGSVQSLVGNAAIGRVRSYIVAAPLELNSTYNISIYTEDSIGNRSSASTVSYTTVKAENNFAPPPNDQYVFSGNGESLLIWRDANPTITESFGVWRAEYGDTLLASDFKLIATVDAKQWWYRDISVENGTRYYYFITRSDIYGRVSKNPVDDNYYFYPFLYSYPYYRGNLTEIENLTAFTSGDADDHDVILSWDVANTEFDGIEIYRSYNNTYEWVKLTSISSDRTSYIDNDALKNSGTYYYYVRQYRNNCKLLLSSASPSDFESAILLSKIIVSNEGVEIKDLRNDISKLAKVVSDYLDEKLEISHHTYSEANDNRVNLKENILFSNFTTTDNKVFTSKEEFSGADSYIVMIDGNYSKVHFNLDVDNNKIIFAQPVTGNVSLECLGLNETDNYLAYNKIQSISPIKFSSNKFLSEQIDYINHDGRKDSLVPLQTRMTSVNGYNFTMSDATEELGESFIFYAVQSFYEAAYCWPLLTLATYAALTPNEYATLMYLCNRVDCSDIYTITKWANATAEELEIINNYCFDSEYYYVNVDSLPFLVAATNKGIAKSTDSGKTWQVIFTPDDGAPLDIKFISDTNYLYCYTAHSVYASRNGSTWIKIKVPSTVSIIRDMCYYNDKLYFTTNAGLYYIDEAVSIEESQAIPVTIIDAKNNNYYGIYEFNNILYLSNEYNLYYSSDAITWSKADVDGIFPIVRFIDYRNILFLLSKMSLSRLKDGIFETVATLNCNEARDLVVYEGKLFILTEDGIVKSPDDVIVYNSLSMDFENAFPIINTPSGTRLCYGMDIVAGNLFISADQRLYRANSNFLVLEIYKDNNNSPTVFVNDNKFMGWVYFDSILNQIHFVDKMKYDDIISVANQYGLFKLENGGILENNCKANIEIVKNNFVLSTFAVASTGDIVESLSNVEFELFSELNSNKVLADVLVAEYNDGVNALAEKVAADEDVNIIDDVRNLSRLFNNIYTNFNGLVTFGSSVEISGTIYGIIGFEKIEFELISAIHSDAEIISEIPTVTVLDANDDGNSLNIVNGLVMLSNEIDKYDNVFANISNVSLDIEITNNHTQVEDKIGDSFIGLPFGICNVISSNFLNILIALKSSHNTDCTIYSDFTMRDYDLINTTFGYKEESATIDTSNAVSYLFYSYYSETFGKMFLCSANGLYILDLTTKEIDNVAVFNGKQAVHMLESNNRLYLMTKNELYYSDNGVSWIGNSLLNLDSEIKTFTKFKNFLIVGASDGVYISHGDFIKWTKVYDVSNVVKFRIYDFLYMIADNNIYYTKNGIDWTLLHANDNYYVSDIIKFNGDCFIATNAGLRFAAGTLYGPNSNFSVVNVLNDVTASKSLSFTVIEMAPDGLSFIAGCSDGSYWKIEDNLNTSFTTEVSCIRNITFVQDDLFMFSFDHCADITNGDTTKLGNGDGF